MVHLSYDGDGINLLWLQRVYKLYWRITKLQVYKNHSYDVLLCRCHNKTVRRRSCYGY